MSNKRKTILVVGVIVVVLVLVMMYSGVWADLGAGDGG